MSMVPARSWKTSSCLLRLSYGLRNVVRLRRTSPPLPFSPTNPACRQPVALMSTKTEATPNSSLMSLQRDEDTAAPSQKTKTVTITFVDRDGDEQTVQGKIGDTLLDVAKDHDVDLEGACEGTLSCSTCHLIMDQEWFDKVPDPLTEEEQDMLDMAYGLTDTSRLGCQIVVTKDLEGIRLTVPSGTRDVRNL